MTEKDRLVLWVSGYALLALSTVLALAVPLMFAHQLTRGAARVRLTASLSFIAVLALSVVAVGCWLQLAQESSGGGLTRGSALTLGAVVAVAAAVDLVGRSPRVDPAATPTVAGVVVGTVVGAM